MPPKPRLTAISTDTGQIQCSGNTTQEKHDTHSECRVIPSKSKKKKKKKNKKKKKHPASQVPQTSNTLLASAVTKSKDQLCARAIQFIRTGLPPQTEELCQTIDQHFYELLGIIHKGNLTLLNQWVAQHHPSAMNNAKVDQCTQRLLPRDEGFIAHIAHAAFASSSAPFLEKCLEYFAPSFLEYRCSVITSHGHEFKSIPFLFILIATKPSFIELIKGLYRQKSPSVMHDHLATPVLYRPSSSASQYSLLTAWHYLIAEADHIRLINFIEFIRYINHGLNLTSILPPARTCKALIDIANDHEKYPLIEQLTFLFYQSGWNKKIKQQHTYCRQQYHLGQQQLNDTKKQASQRSKELLLLQENVTQLKQQHASKEKKSNERHQEKDSQIAQLTEKLAQTNKKPYQHMATQSEPDPVSAHNHELQTELLQLQKQLEQAKKKQGKQTTPPIITTHYSTTQTQEEPNITRLKEQLLVYQIQVEDQKKSLSRLNEKILRYREHVIEPSPKRKIQATAHQGIVSQSSHGTSGINPMLLHTSSGQLTPVSCPPPSATEVQSREDERLKHELQIMAQENASLKQQCKDQQQYFFNYQQKMMHLQSRQPVQTSSPYLPSCSMSSSSKSSALYKAVAAKQSNSQCSQRSSRPMHYAFPIEQTHTIFSPNIYYSHERTDSRIFDTQYLTSVFNDIIHTLAPSTTPNKTTLLWSETLVMLVKGHQQDNPNMPHCDIDVVLLVKNKTTGLLRALTGKDMQHIIMLCQGKLSKGMTHEMTVIPNNDTANILLHINAPDGHPIKIDLSLYKNKTFEQIIADHCICTKGFGLTMLVLGNNECSLGEKWVSEECVDNQGLLCVNQQTLDVIGDTAITQNNLKYFIKEFSRENSTNKRLIGRIQDTLRTLTPVQQHCLANQVYLSKKKRNELGILPITPPASSQAIDNAAAQSRLFAQSASHPPKADLRERQSPENRAAAATSTTRKR